jgi:uroporphyrinogen-III synthase
MVDTASKSPIAEPLKGRRIVVTRAREQSEGLMASLEALGATAILCPAIRIEPLHDSSNLDAAVSSLHEYDWVIFTSANGVRAFSERMRARGVEAEVLCSRKLAAIGPATRAEVEKLGCAVSFVPDTHVAEVILEQIGDVAGQRMLLPKADIAREALAEGLTRMGAQVDEVAAYHTVAGGEHGTLAPMLRAGEIDAVTFTSSSTVRYTIEGLTAEMSREMSREEAVALLGRAALVCIGPITAGTARECGLTVTAVAEEYTTRGLLDALLKLFGVEAEGRDVC